MISALRQALRRGPTEIVPRRPRAVRRGMREGRTQGDVGSMDAAPVPWAVIIGAGVVVATLLLSIVLLAWVSTRPLIPPGPGQRLDEAIVDCCTVAP